MTQAVVPDELWLPARLIPTAGIRGQEEQEARATSALLSVMMAVPEFGRAITNALDAPAGKITTYIEVPLKLASGEKIRPDGVVVVARGNRTWCALVEVKTGTNELDKQQVEKYLDAAREMNFDCVWTVSNQIVGSAASYPIEVDRRKLRRVQLHHRSWLRVLTEAAFQYEHKGIDDPDQAYILSELIRYLEHPRSGALKLEDMGSEWVAVRDGARNGTLRLTQSGVLDVAGRWDQLIQYLALDLGRLLGAHVVEVLTRRERADPNVRRDALVRELVDQGSLSGALRIPGAVGDVAVTASLRSRLVSAALTLDAPASGRPATKVRWLLRQLTDAPGDLRVDTAFNGTRQTTSALLREARDDEERLLIDRKLEPRKFMLTLSAPMGMRRDAVRGSFIDSVAVLLHDFYRDVVQVIRPWRQAAPRLPSAPEIQAVDDESEHSRLDDGGDSPIQDAIMRREDEARENTYAETPA